MASTTKQTATTWVSTLGAVITHGQLTIASIALGNSWIALTLTNGAPIPGPDVRDAVLIPVLVFWFVYGLDRIMRVDSDSDPINHGARVGFAQRYGRWLGLLYASALVVGLGLAARQGLGVLALAVVPLVAGVAYSLPFRSTGQIRRLKDIPGIKSLVVVGSWLTGSALLATVVLGLSDPWVVGWFLCATACRDSASTLTGDAADLAGDEQEGVRTLPAILGRQTTTQLVAGLSALRGMSLTAAGVLAGLNLAPMVLVGVTTAALGGWVTVSSIRDPHGFGRRAYDWMDLENLAAAVLLALAAVL